MTSERSKAYGRVMGTIRSLGPSKLHDHEEQRVREAADSLFFADDLAADEGAKAALADARALARQLVESGRWDEERAERLVSDIEACGPLSAVS